MEGLVDAVDVREGLDEHVEAHLPGTAGVQVHRERHGKGGREVEGCDS